MSVKVIRLITNEEVIGEFSETETSYTIKKPAMLGFLADDDGKPNMVIQKYLPHSEQGDDAEITVDRSNVLFTFDPLSEILNHYNAQLGSGIITPPKGKGIV
tara:strand:+ start:89 stop:394 length:306 start_codon:yes stop_codon:yes gene_type:complete